MLSCIRRTSNNQIYRTDQDYCYPKVIGYAPAKIMAGIDHTSSTRAGSDSADALTRAFVLHPVACALAFIAAIISIGGVVGGLIGSMVAVVAWLITLVVMAIDFAAFGVSHDPQIHCLVRTGQILISM